MALRFHSLVRGTGHNSRIYVKTSISQQNPFQQNSLLFLMGFYPLSLEALVQFQGLQTRKATFMAACARRISLRACRPMTSWSRRVATMCSRYI